MQHRKLFLSRCFRVAATGCLAWLFTMSSATAAETAAECLVSGRIVSSEYKKLGGGIERAIVSAWTVPENKRAGYELKKGEAFEIRLPPGKYVLECSANGTRGATFRVTRQDITVPANEKNLSLGIVDLPVSKTTALYGQPAPELDRIIGWKNAKPTKLKDLRGKVVVLDFFNYSCTICHAHKPDLVKLKEKYAKQGLVVLALHDDSVASLDEMNEKMDPILARVFRGNVPKFAMALDGKGPGRVFDQYGIYAVPSVILIDQQGRVVQRFHHAGRPELDAEIRKLLKVRS